MQGEILGFGVVNFGGGTALDSNRRNLNVSEPDGTR